MKSSLTMEESVSFHKLSWNHLQGTSPKSTVDMITDRRLFWGQLIQITDTESFCLKSWFPLQETDLQESWQDSLSLQVQMYPWIPTMKFSITDTDFGRETNYYCNHFGYNGPAKNTSHMHCNAPPICVAKYFQYSSHAYRGTPYGG